MSQRVLSSLYGVLLCSCILLSGCSGDANDKEAEAEAQPDAQTEEAGSEEAAPKDAYDDYIRNAIASVDKGTPAAPEAETAEDKEQPFEGRSVTVDRTAPNNLYVSSEEGPDSDNDPVPVIPTQSPSPDLSSSTAQDASPSPTTDPSGTPTPTPTPYITPEEFECDTCCIYINGESDSAFGTEVVTAINKTREDLGYKPFVSNKGLATCADRRTRELAASYSHTRPNGKPFYSVAPEHFKAEMLVVGTQKAEDAVDTLIKTDPVSRALIFTNKYQSIGASSFKCNGKQCTVVAFGL